MLTVRFEDIRQADDLLAGHIVRTPCEYSRTLSEITGADVFLKFENHQFTASFKERGALISLLSLSAEQRRTGIIAMSAGNHAQGVAYHAQRLGVPATIVMPRFTPSVKVFRTRAFGAEVILHGDSLAEARSIALTLAKDRGLTLIHPYDTVCRPNHKGVLPRRKDGRFKRKNNYYHRRQPGDRTRPGRKICP